MIGVDGRNSQVHAKAGLQSKTFGSSRDVLWLRLDKLPGDPMLGMGYKGPRQNFIVIDLGDYWQCGYTLEKGQLDALKLAGLDALKAAMAQAAPFSVARMAQLKSWKQAIRIDRLKAWMKPSVLCIGAAANALTQPLKKGTLTLRDLQKVQQIISRYPFLCHLFGRLIGLGSRRERPLHLKD